MPQQYEVDATCATPGITRVELTLNGINVPLDADADGNYSGTKNMNLPGTFQGAVGIRAMEPTKWTVSIEISMISDGADVLKQDITGTIKEADAGIGQWAGPLTLTLPTPASRTAGSI
jgi:hypothetical protein